MKIASKCKEKTKTETKEVENRLTRLTFEIKYNFSCKPYMVVYGLVSNIFGEYRRSSIGKIYYHHKTGQHIFKADFFIVSLAQEPLNQINIKIKDLIESKELMK